MCRSITRMLYWLFAIALLLFALQFREHYTDPNECTTTGVTRDGRACVPKITRPSMQEPRWLSKIDAEAPIGGNDADYIKVLQAFYDNVYVPATTRPTEADVEAFLKTPAGQVAGVDDKSLRKIIASGFNIERSGTVAAREEKETVTTGALAGFTGSNLQPRDGVDQVRTRTESIYTPADSRSGETPEGIYAPVPQQARPRRPGYYDDKSISWTPNSFASVCECAKNVL
jgi:hypothetical protein